MSLCIDSFVFISVYFVCFFHTAYSLYYRDYGGVDLMGLKPSPLDLSSLSVFDTVGWVI